MSERTGPDQAFQLRPSVKLLERSDTAVPGCGGYPCTRFRAPACTMERIDIRAHGGPDRLAASGVQKPDPHRDVIAVGAQRVGRAHAVQRQIKEEAVEVGVVTSGMPSRRMIGTWRSRPSAARRSSMLMFEIAVWLSTGCSTFPRTPIRTPASTRGVLPGPALSRPASASYVGSAAAGLDNASLGPLHDACPGSVRDGADCQDKAQSSSREYIFEPNPPERSRANRDGWPVQ